MLALNNMILDSQKEIITTEVTVSDTSNIFIIIVIFIFSYY